MAAIFVLGVHISLASRSSNSMAFLIRSLSCSLSVPSWVASSTMVSISSSVMISGFLILIIFVRSFFQRVNIQFNGLRITNIILKKGAVAFKMIQAYPLLYF